MTVIVQAANVGPDPEEIDLDGVIDGAIEYVGTAKRLSRGSYVCLAKIGLALCRVALSIAPSIPAASSPSETQGDDGD